MRTRLALREYQKDVKNRIVAAINCYGLRDREDDGDLFRGKGRAHVFDFDPRSCPFPREGTSLSCRLASSLVLSGYSAKRARTGRAFLWQC